MQTGFSAQLLVWETCAKACNLVSPLYLLLFLLFLNNSGAYIEINCFCLDTENEFEFRKNALDNEKFREIISLGSLERSEGVYECRINSESFF